MSKTFFSLVADLENSLNQLNSIILGDENETININGIEKDSISKLIKSQFLSLQSMISGRTPYETFEELNTASPTENNVLAEVWNDSDADKNGLYGWTNNEWVRSEYDPKTYADKIFDTVMLIQGATKAEEQKNSYRDATQYAWHVIDKLGRVALAIHPNGYLEHGPVINNIDDLERDYLDVIWAIKDRNGSISLGVKENGTLVFNDVSTNVKEVEKRNLGNRFVWSVKDKTGKAAIGIDEKGEIHGSASEQFKATLLDHKLISSQEFSENYNSINARDFFNFKLATIQESDKAIFDVRKVNDGKTETALIERQEPMLFIPVSGQSNSTSTGPGGVLFDSSAYPHNCMTYSHSSTIQGTKVANEQSFVDMQPINDLGASGQRPATLASFSLEDLIRKKTGLPSPGMLAFTPFYSGKPIEYFLPGTNTFQNISIAAKKSREVANKYSRDIECKFFTFIQGENGSEDYKNKLIGLAADIKNEISNQLEQPYFPEFVILQINVAESRNYASGIEQDQLEAAYDPLNGITLAGPMYDAPVDDGIHQNAIGRMIIGQKLAVCYQSIIEHGTFTPLWPLEVTLNGRDVDIVFSTPGEGLEFDLDWITEVPNYGFVYSDDSNSAEIESVEITSKNTVRIKLTAEPNGDNRAIKYAVINETDVDGWTNGRGQLFAKTSIKSLYHSLGFPVPEMFRHYCVRFTKEF